uniref:Uncharacterized protein n=1 Tax=Anopheles culicifacies TaxID=139723 RepID=A0A182LY45_9DIPT
MPIVNGDGPREDPIPTLGLRNSKLPTLSARAICDAGLTRSRATKTNEPDENIPHAMQSPTKCVGYYFLPAASDRLDGGLGIAILLPPAEVGVGICRCVSFVRLADAGAEILISPTSENISPRSAYRLLQVKRDSTGHHKDEPTDETD